VTPRERFAPSNRPGPNGCFLRSRFPRYASLVGEPAANPAAAAAAAGAAPSPPPPRAQLFVSGSTRLGVGGPDADLDAVVACPRAVTRAHFFGGLARALRAHARVARLVTVEEGLVPLMAFVFDGVDVDLTFASVPRDRVPASVVELLDDRVLVGLDQASARCLNGPRVTELLVRMVPRPSQRFCGNIFVFLFFQIGTRAAFAHGYGPGSSFSRSSGSANLIYRQGTRRSSCACAACGCGRSGAGSTRTRRASSAA